MLPISRRTTLASLLLPVAAAAQPTTTTLSFWHNHPEWKDRVIAILKRFEADHPTIRIDLQEMPTTAYTARMQTALAAGRGTGHLVAAGQARTCTPLPRPAISPT